MRAPVAARASAVAGCDEEGVAFLASGDAISETAQQPLSSSDQNASRSAAPGSRQDAPTTAIGADAASKAFLDKCPAYDGVAPTVAGRLYPIDPLGNLVLSYSAAAPDKALLADVKKLLRLSHIG